MAKTMYATFYCWDFCKCMGRYSVNAAQNRQSAIMLGPDWHYDNGIARVHGFHSFKKRAI